MILLKMMKKRINVFCVWGALISAICLPIEGMAQRVRAYNFAPDEVESDYRFFAARTVGGLQSMVVDKASGDGSVSSAPFRTYIPFFSDGADVDQRDYSSLSSPPNMPEIDTDQNLLAFFRFDVEVSNTSNDESISPRIAIQNSSGDYQVTPLAANPNTISPGELERRVAITLSFEALCDVVSNKCNDFVGAQPGSRQENFKAYIFATDDPLSTDEVIDPESDYTNGLFYEFRMSDRVPGGALDLKELNRGDKRLFLNFEGGESITRMTSELRYLFLVFDYAPGGGTGDENRTLGDALGLGGSVVIRDEEFRSPEGRYGVTQLKNGQTYDLAIALVNKYQFASQLSLSREGTPEEIEALLTAQSCFILTAGFEGEHPIVNDFRSFRDNFLAYSERGKLFIRGYYHWGPQASQWILENAGLSSYVRAMAYLVHAFFSLWFYIALAGPLLLVSCLVAFRLPRKNIFGQANWPE